MSETACRLHPGSTVEGSCTACGRAVCLPCAVPVRGRTLCFGCASRRLGAPAESDPPPGRRWRPADLASGALFLAAVLISLLPWDRSGDLTGALSSWVPRSDPWPLLAGVLIAAAALLSLVSAGGAGSRRVHGGVGLVAVVATIVALPAPGLAARSPVPFVVLALAAAGTVTSLLRRPRAAT